ncbi:chymotrypsin inhibitor 3-like [Vigna unguiculata]|uniref:Kunitz inhibitor ST1-like n=1 Tax=Vigna unguiculata TaxID=3917 RepID=A0A4D6NE70_VIGUN|nr:chymotrypsin inhibitor 3-like [Vigna unguiculata]QCE11034.1 Kunitz inhibitor ST1-like [Vigna unguiculata]
MASATLFALFLLSALTLYPPSTTAQPVTDANGNIVKNGGRFFILPLFFGAGGGGIRRARTGYETSPLSVVQSPLETDDGQPWIITSIFKSGFIPEGSRVSISYEYVELGDSVESNEWSAVAGLPEGTLVKVGYPNTINGSFSIHRASSANSYKFLFCSASSSVCGNVGIVLDKAGNRLLAIKQETSFEFVLVELPSAVSK